MNAKYTYIYMYTYIHIHTCICVCISTLFNHESHISNLYLGNNIDVYPGVSVILSAVKDPALGLSMRRLRDPSLCSG